LSVILFPTKNFAHLHPGGSDHEGNPDKWFLGWPFLSLPTRFTYLSSCRKMAESMTVLLPAPDQHRKSVPFVQLLRYADRCNHGVFQWECSPREPSPRDPPPCYPTWEIFATKIWGVYPLLPHISCRNETVVGKPIFFWSTSPKYSWVSIHFGSSCPPKKNYHTKNPCISSYFSFLLFLFLAFIRSFGPRPSPKVISPLRDPNTPNKSREKIIWILYTTHSF